MYILCYSFYLKICMYAPLYSMYTCIIVMVKFIGMLRSIYIIFLIMPSERKIKREKEINLAFPSI